jgi:cytochrome P450
VAYVEKALRFNPASPVFQENLHNLPPHAKPPACSANRQNVGATRYQDVYQTLKERAFVSSGIPEDVHSEMEKECFSLAPIRDLLYGIMLFEDGNVHRAPSGAASSVYRRSWAALTQLISDESHTLVAELTTTGTIDGIRQIAAPLWGSCSPPGSTCRKRRGGG